MLPKRDLESSMDVDATQAGSFANLCAGDATKVREVLYSLLVGRRNMFSLNSYIVAQIAAFQGCDSVSIRRRLMIILIVVHGFFSFSLW
jgi:hypothetical protein